MNKQITTIEKAINSFSTLNPVLVSFFRLLLWQVLTFSQENFNSLNDRLEGISHMYEWLEFHNSDDQLRPLR